MKSSDNLKFNPSGTRSPRWARWTGTTAAGAMVAATLILAVRGPRAGAELVSPAPTSAAGATLSARQGTGTAAPADIATAREMTIDGQTIGEVDVNGRPAIRIRAASGGYTAMQRAQVVAQRLNRLQSRSTPPELRVAVMNGQTVVADGAVPIITASVESARLNGSTPPALASRWADNLNRLLRLPALAETTYHGTTPYTVPVVEEHNTQKLVPILSVGTGTRLGAALVTGPSYRVSQVAAVAQIEGKWKNIVDARVLVPVSNPNVSGGLHRVPETSVYAVANYRLP